MTAASDDFYCDFVFSGKVDVAVVEETAGALAFHHTRPFWRVHVVVVPKAHVPPLVSREADAVLPEVMELVRRVAAKVLESEGAVQVLTNLGTYQDSKHLHFHVASGERLREG